MGRVHKLLRTYGLGSNKYKAHNQNQNPTKRHIQEVKGIICTVLDCYFAPSWSWILWMAYVVVIINWMAHRSLYWSNQNEADCGFTPNVTHLIELVFWDPILILDNKNKFPKSCEIFGYNTGPAPNKGDINCSWVWTKEHGLIYCYVLRHHDITADPNRHMLPASGETETESSTAPINT